MATTLATQPRTITTLALATRTSAPKQTGFWMTLLRALAASIA
jgi:hypothetical protein